MNDLQRYLADRPIVRRASKTHRQIRQLRGKHGDGRYLVWPDGRPTLNTGAIASCFKAREGDCAGQAMIDRCKDCPKPSPDGSRCGDCRVLHNAREKARRQERQRLLLCWVCGGKALKNERVCKSHDGYRAEQARKAG